jgi:hypothetical protein
MLRLQDLHKLTHECTSRQQQLLLLCEKHLLTGTKGCSFLVVIIIVIVIIIVVAVVRLLVRLGSALPLQHIV